MLLLSIPLLGMALILLSNLLLFPRLRAPQSRRIHSSPLVSLLVPARNEANHIDGVVQSLRAQTYPNVEILILDDHSEDGTAQIAQTAAQADPRVRILTGAPLPTGWGGKNWACHQLAQQARGEWLIFTDADVRWQTTALESVLNLAQRECADLLTVWSSQITVTWAERLTVPLMAMVVWAYLPIFGTHFTPFAAFATANGQCMVFRRGAYQKINGHEGVRGAIIEDIQLARRIKSAGLRLRMADGAGLITCRMYQNWGEVRSGYAKNMLAGYGNRLVLLALATVFHWAVFLFPWGGAIWGVLNQSWDAAASYGVLIALGLAIRAVSASTTGQRIQDTLLMPVSVVLMTIIAAQSAWQRIRYGGAVWKGRVLK